MKYSPELQQEIEQAREVIAIWLSKPERQAIVMNIANNVTGAIHSPKYEGKGLSLLLDHESLVVLEKAMHLLNGLLLTASRMAAKEQPEGLN